MCIISISPRPEPFFFQDSIFYLHPIPNFETNSSQYGVKTTALTQKLVSKAKKLHSNVCTTCFVGPLTLDITVMKLYLEISRLDQQNNV